MTLSFETAPELALAWHRAGRGAALATVVQTWGSAPRGVGSQLVVSANGEIEGSVSGGCVEGAVVFEAQAALQDGEMRLLEYGVTDDDAFAVGLACGGTIRILVEPIGSGLTEEMLADICTARAARTGVAYEVHTQTGTRRLIAAGAGHGDRFRADRSGFEEDTETFVHIHNPPLRMIVVGAVHIAQSLVSMARMAGYDVMLVDPREAFASAERFPETVISHDWPDEALRDFGLDARTAVVTLTHDPKLDDPAIVTALGADVFYLGCLGSQRTHAKRVTRLTDAGLTPEQIARIHAPVGLNIGSKTPAEIAVSIMAQVTDVLRVQA